LAGVKPRFEHFTGKSIAAFIASNNIYRRHLTKGQQAMALAFAHPEPEKGGRGNTGTVKEAKRLGGFSDERLRQARQLLRHSEEMAMAVLAGGLKFDEALKIMKEREEADTKPEVRIAGLRARYPDLAAKVVKEELTI
jgi:hypothetical protein